MEGKFAVITGSSQGLGKSFAYQLAAEGWNLILISLPGEDLKRLSMVLKDRFGIQTYYYETDLTIRENIMAVSEWINREFNIHMLINNAGIGGTKRFEEASCVYIEKIIQLNVLATTLLTHQLLRNLKRQEKAYILNVSSLAAFSPIAYKTVYPASKAFIHSFFPRALSRASRHQCFRKCCKSRAYAYEC